MITKKVLLKSMTTALKFIGELPVEINCLLKKKKKKIVNILNEVHFFKTT